MKGSTHIKRIAAVLGLFLFASISAFAKDSKTIRLPDPAWLAGIELAPGEYEFSWVSHSPEATVTLKQGRKVVATVDGKWVERSVKYDRNALVYEMSTNGSRRIIEIRFAGKSQALIFEEPGSTEPGLKEPGPKPAPTASLELPCAATVPGAAFAMPAGNGRCIQFLGKPRIARRASTSDDLTVDLWHEAFPERARAVGPHRK